jgi:hypothetical protein
MFRGRDKSIIFIGGERGDVVSRPKQRVVFTYIYQKKNRSNALDFVSATL